MTDGREIRAVFIFFKKECFGFFSQLENTLRYTRESAIIFIIQRKKRRKRKMMAIVSREKDSTWEAMKVFCRGMKSGEFLVSEEMEIGVQLPKVKRIPKII
jgi:hypothetical protein